MFRDLKTILVEEILLPLQWNFMYYSSTIPTETFFLNTASLKISTVSSSYLGEKSTTLLMKCPIFYEKTV